MSSPEPGLVHRRHAAPCLAATSRLSPYLAHGCLSARRLYAEVRAFDVRPVTREQVESCGGTFLEVPPAPEGEVSSIFSLYYK